MSRRIIHSVLLTDYRPLLWKGIPVYRRIEGIRGVLRERRRDLEFLFCEPLITDGAAQSRDSAHWLTELPDLSEVRNYSILGAAEQELLLSRLKQAFEAVGGIAGELKQSGSPDQQELGEVLLSAMQIPALDCIYMVGDKVLLVVWGFVHKNAENWNFNISRVLEQVSSLPAAPPVAPQADTVVIPSEPPPVTPPLLPPLAPPVVPPAPPVLPKDDSGGGGKKKEPPSRRWIYYLIGAILVLLLILLLLWLLKAKKASSSLPSDPTRFQPFDTTKIVEDTMRDPNSNSGGQKIRIVGNRLNAKIDPKITLKDFAIRFKTKFPDDAQVKVVYFDTVDHSIQIEFYKQDLAYWRSQLQQWKECTGTFREIVGRIKNIPTDPGFAQEEINYPFQMTGVYNAWDGTQGDSVVVAIIDNGFDIHHPELENKIWKPFNEKNRNADVSVGIFQANIHGTHVATLAAGNANNGKGAAGFAPKCLLMPIQITLDENSISGITSALDYAIKQGADVINMSIGLLGDGQPLSYQEQINLIEHNPEMKMIAEKFQARYQLANQVNTIIVQAAGNETLLCELDPMKRSDFTINVGACDSHLDKASFSNYGREVTVTAPGVNIFSAVPGGEYKFMSGTSMSSPIVAGGVALMKSIKKDLTVAEAKKILIETGLPLNPSGYEMGPLVQFGKAIKKLQAGNNACDDRADSLQRVIDSLERKLKQQTTYFQIPPHVTDCAFATGDWYSSNDLINDNTHQSVKLLFRFTGNCDGILFFVEKNKICQAPITMNIENGVFKITQTANAPCDNHQDFYKRHYFECVPDASGVAQCKAFSLETNHPVINFRLYKN